MLINFRHLCSKYKFVPKGIIHIGAHLGEEFGDYNSLGVKKIVWIEGNPEVFARLKNKLKGADMHFINHIVSDKEREYEFHITNNGESSSILEMDRHLIHHKNVHVTKTIKLKSKRMDNIIKDSNIDISEYDFLNLDIQGAELMALKSFGDLLSHINYIYTEVNTGEVYKGCAKVHEIDEYLSQFERKETSMTPYEWGDAFYIKRGIANK